VAERGELEDPPFARSLGIASRLALALHGRAGGRLLAPAGSVAVWRGLQSKRYLNVFKKLLPLWQRKAEYQPSESRQKSIPVTGL
jgi:hypothetical protein